MHWHSVLHLSGRPLGDTTRSAPPFLPIFTLVLLKLLWTVSMCQTMCPQSSGYKTVRWHSVADELQCPLFAVCTALGPMALSCSGKQSCKPLSLPVQKFHDGSCLLVGCTTLILLQPGSQQALGLLCSLLHEPKSAQLFYCCWLFRTNICCDRQRKMPNLHDPESWK